MDRPAILGKNHKKRVCILPDNVALRIAAGEVIDRPYAAVRELLDNAIDSGAKEITLNLEGGGIDGIRVSDDGCGMDSADLEICWLPHATSKITALGDLEKISTLGFRGEALSSLAACSRLELVSSTGKSAHKLRVDGGKLLEAGPSMGAAGTSVAVRDLFFNMPARRNFLKSKNAESNLCRRVFLEKAAAHPDVSFRLFTDGVLKAFFPKQSFLERISAAFPRLSTPSSWWETLTKGDSLDIVLVHARPEISRKDRQYIQVYVNRRRIDEFSLVQAVAYAYDAWMPGGTFPIAFVFIEIDPALIDFNIHPAKKEARFRDLPAVRQQIVQAIRDKITAESYKTRDKDKEIPDRPVQTNLTHYETSENFASVRDGASIPSSSYHASKKADSKKSAAFATATTELGKRNSSNGPLTRHSPTAVGKDQAFLYLGQTMGVFLLAESLGSLFVVDQHAAHERILFEKMRKSDARSERLVISHPLDLDDAALMKLELRRERLKSLGMEFEMDSDGSWALTAMPEAARGMEGEVVAFIESGAGDAQGLEKNLWADLACKAAIKDNSILDDEAAKNLLAKAFALEEPRCPHGRPIWFEVSRNELFELVGRRV